jgi:PTS system cellobiose-specific IIC component
VQGVIDKLTAVSGAIAQNWVIQVIMKAFMMLLPITMLGSFAALFKGLGIEAYQAFIASNGVAGVLATIYQWTTGMIGVYLAFLVAYAFAQHTKCAKSEMAVGLVSLACFLIVTPFQSVPTDFGVNTLLPTDWLGSSGMFTAIIISFVVGGIYLFCQKFHIEIKLPDAVPPFISAQFSSLIPGAIAMVLFGIVSALFAGTEFGTLHQLVYSVIASPLHAVTGNVFGTWILMVTLYGLWFLGIHGGMTVGPIIMMLFMQAQMENMAAFQAGTPMPNLCVGDSLTYGTGSLPMLVAALIFMKSAQGKAVSRMAILPAFFGVDEPAYFGMPMILNPLFFIPWVLGAPTLSVFGTHALKLIGLLPYSNGTAGSAANLPFFVGNAMGYGTAGIIWGCVFFVLIVLMYVPFVKAYDKQLQANEADVEAEAVTQTAAKDEAKAETVAKAEAETVTVPEAKLEVGQPA